MKWISEAALYISGIVRCMRYDRGESWPGDIQNPAALLQAKHFVSNKTLKEEKSDNFNVDQIMQCAGLVLPLYDVMLSNFGSNYDEAVRWTFFS
jgi:hypothetical protein